MPRKLIMPLVVGGLIGLPFWMSAGDDNQSDLSGLTGANVVNQGGIPSYLPNSGIQVTGGLGQVVDFGGKPNVILPGNANGPDLNAMPLAFVPITNFGEVFSFDIAVPSIKQRWERVSIFEAPNNVTAYRVDLVTGVNRTDVYGCLTYYVGSSGKIDKVDFRGWTGDVQPFVDFATSSFNLKKVNSRSLGAYLNASWGSTVGALLLQNPPIIRQDNPNQSVAIFLEVCRPGAGGKISDELKRAIQSFE
ncbi:MAG: DUF6690 family protein [Pirellulaceae bacterium]